MLCKCIPEVLLAVDSQGPFSLFSGLFYQLSGVKHLIFNDNWICQVKSCINCGLSWIKKKFMDQNPFSHVKWKTLSETIRIAILACLYFYQMHCGKFIPALNCTKLKKGLLRKGWIFGLSSFNNDVSVLWQWQVLINMFLSTITITKLFFAGAWLVLYLQQSWKVYFLSQESGDRAQTHDSWIGCLTFWPDELCRHSEIGRKAYKTDIPLPLFTNPHLHDCLFVTVNNSLCWYW